MKALKTKKTKTEFLISKYAKVIRTIMKNHNMKVSANTIANF